MIYDAHGRAFRRAIGFERALTLVPRLSGSSAAAIGSDTLAVDEELAIAATRPEVLDDQVRDDRA